MAQFDLRHISQVDISFELGEVDLTHFAQGFGRRARFLDARVKQSDQFPQPIFKQRNQNVFFFLEI
ncbi:hypothetical protein D1872_346410 [compost metagenome]